MRLSPDVQLPIILLVLVMARPPAAAQATPPLAPIDASGDAPGAAAADQRAEANKLYGAANKLVREGTGMLVQGRIKCQDALSRFKKAYELYPSFKIDLNIGGTLAAMGQLTEAAAYFERFLSRGHRAPRPIIEAARRRLARIRQDLSCVTVKCHVEGALIQLDGEEAGVTPQKVPCYLRPGKHVLIVRKAGHSPETQNLAQKKGQHVTIDTTLKPTAEQEQAYMEHRRRLETRRRKTIVGYVALAGGAALAVGGAVLYALGGVQGPDVYDPYQGTNSINALPRHEPDIDSARRLIVGDHVMDGLAAAATGVAIWQLVTRPKVEETTPSRPGLSPSVIPAPGGAAFSPSGSL